LGYIDARYLVSQKQVYFPDLVREVAQQFNFQKFPQTIEEHDLNKGVEFWEGKTGKKVIQKFVIWDSLLVLETTSSTDDSKAILEEILLWAVEKFQINYETGAIKKYAYISDITFFSDAPLLKVGYPVELLAKECTESVSEIWQEPVEYQPISLKIGHDPVNRKFGIAPFSIERKGDAKFSENRYFSEAPLPTSQHLKMLEEFEMNILLTQKAGNL
jgi:hypothetical protein